ncbi:MAG: nucleotidyl transferase AbiEii/AbiGii toxin family protein [Lentimicrobiaceae bacterium]|nr:nucleotidyl transferase AbiEii/AbiGii toxin family protein [Lentimicrobiaceae bacterium]
MVSTTLTQNRDLFINLVTATRQFFVINGLNIDSASIEKDFYVYLMLKEFAQSEHAKKAFFKGGTALSRVWKITERFSEDVDLCMNPKANNTRKKSIEQRDKISKDIAQIFPQIDRHPDENKGGLFRKTVHPYPKIISADTSQIIGENILLEMSSTRPERMLEATKEFVNSYIGDFLQENNQTDIIERYDLKPVELLVLLPEYTLSDKLCRMLKEANKPDSEIQIGAKIRDLYDIHKLLQNERIRKVFYSDKFIEIFNSTEADEALNRQTIPSFSETPLFASPNEVLALQKGNYERFKPMIHRNPPELSDIAKTLIDNFERFRALDKHKIAPQIKAEETVAPKPETKPSVKRVPPQKKRGIRM